MLHWQIGRASRLIYAQEHIGPEEKKEERLFQKPLRKREKVFRVLAMKSTSHSSASLLHVEGTLALLGGLPFPEAYKCCTACYFLKRNNMKACHMDGNTHEKKETPQGARCIYLLSFWRYDRTEKKKNWFVMLASSESPRDCFEICARTRSPATQKA